MADATMIKLRRGNGLHSSYITSANFSTNYKGAFTNAEPWINTASKQLWVDKTCINPTPNGKDGVIVGNAYLNNGEVFYDISADMSYIQSSIGEKTLTFAKGTTTATFKPITNDYTLNFGKGIAFENNEIFVDLASGTTADYLSFVNGKLTFNPGNLVKDGFLDTVTYTEADNTLHFTWNTAAEKSQLNVPLHAIVEDVDTTYEAGNYLNKTEGTTTNYVFNHNTTTRTDTTGTATEFPSAGITVVTGVTSETYGHVTSVETTKFTLPATAFSDTDTDTQTKVAAGNKVTVTANPTTFAVGDVNTFTVNHATVTAPAEAITENQTLTFGGSFDIVSGVEEDGYGHVTGLKTRTITMPNAQSFSNTAFSGDTDDNKKYMSLTEDGTVTIRHKAQTNNVGTKVEWTDDNNNNITMDIVIIDGGTF